MYRVCVALFFIVLVAGCSKPAPQLIASDPRAAPFIGLDPKLPEATRKILAEASDDFLAVSAGKAPIHAKADTNAALPADGGTAFYVGTGYKLVVLKSLSSFGELRGYIYGPMIDFDESFAPGNMRSISNVRFYSHEELRKLQGG